MADLSSPPTDASGTSINRQSALVLLFGWLVALALTWN